MCGTCLSVLNLITSNISIKYLLFFLHVGCSSQCSECCFHNGRISVPFGAISLRTRFCPQLKDIDDVQKQMKDVNGEKQSVKKKRYMTERTWKFLWKFILNLLTLTIFGVKLRIDTSKTLICSNPWIDQINIYQKSMSHIYSKPQVHGVNMGDYLDSVGPK